MFYDFEFDSISEEGELMTLSKETINKLADALTLEVIDYILNNPKNKYICYEYGFRGIMRN